MEIKAKAGGIPSIFGRKRPASGCLVSFRNGQSREQGRFGISSRWPVELGRSQKGDRVRKWQGIASLDQRTVQKNLEKELNDYLKTRWDFQGNRETYNVTTDNLDRYTLTPAVRRLLEKSQFDLNNSVLDVELQAVVKEFSSIVSPFSGIGYQRVFTQSRY